MTATRTMEKPILTEGMQAPDFAMPTDDGGIVTLADFRGKTLVLYFYPKDDTPGCTAEACTFRDNLPHFQSVNAAIMGVSKDDVTSHGKFRNKFSLNFPLATDTDGSVCEAYGVWGEKSMYGKKYMGIDRATFLIDGTGLVRKVWRKVKVEGHDAQVKAAIAAL